MTIKMLTPDLSVMIDRLCYGRWTLTWWNFVQFNVFQGGSAHFGVNPWYYYFVDGLPLVIGPVHYVLLLYSTIMCQWRPSRTHLPLIGASVLYVLIHTVFIAHKEQRFLQPLVPLYCIVIGDFFMQLEDGTKKKNVTIYDVISCLTPFGQRLLQSVCAFGLITGLYLCLFHQRAPLSVMQFISAASPLQVNNDRIHALFLMPCHSTPYYSHVHHNVPMRFLRCEPNFGNEIVNYVEEADLFYENPKEWVNREFFNGQNGALPRMIVMFDKMWPVLQSTLDKNYTVCEKFFHMHFPVSQRHSHYMLVACANE